MLDIQTDAQGPADCVTIRLTGDATLREIDALQLHLRRVGSSHPRRVIVDLSRVGFMASLALGTLVEFTSGVKTRDGRVAIAGATGMNLDAIRRSRLDTLFVMSESVDAAANSLRQLLPPHDAAADSTTQRL